MDPLLITIAVLAGIAVVLLVVLLFRKPEIAFADRVRAELDRVSAAMREELRQLVLEGCEAMRGEYEKIEREWAPAADEVWRDVAE